MEDETFFYLMRPFYTPPGKLPALSSMALMPIKSVLQLDHFYHCCFSLMFLILPVLVVKVPLVHVLFSNFSKVLYRWKEAGHESAIDRGRSYRIQILVKGHRESKKSISLCVSFQKVWLKAKVVTVYLELSVKRGLARPLSG